MLEFAVQLCIGALPFLKPLLEALCLIHHTRYFNGYLL
jgi:hypothetical protein